MNTSGYEEDSLISCASVAARLNDPEMICLEAAFVLPGTIVPEYTERIPNSRLFDIEAIADPSASQPHTVPSEQDFARAVAALGVSRDSFVVCFDRYGLFSAARVWWMFKLFGHHKVAIMNGGMKRWQQLNLPLESITPQEFPQGEYTAEFQPDYYARQSDVYAAIEAGTTIVDARPAGRFSGQAPEPREGMRSGHMPGAYNLPFMHLSDETTGMVRSRSELEALFSGIPDQGKAIFSCGSGITAAAALFAAELVGRSGCVYDGSWSEWGADPKTPIEKSI